MNRAVRFYNLIKNQPGQKICGCEALKLLGTAPMRAVHELKKVLKDEYIERVGTCPHTSQPWAVYQLHSPRVQGQLSLSNQNA